MAPASAAAPKATAASAAPKTDRTLLPPRAPVPKAPAGGDTEAEFQTISRQLRAARAGGTEQDKTSSDPVTFDMKDSAQPSDEDAAQEATHLPEYYEADISPPDVPPPPDDFDDEDLALREVLREFYLVHGAEKLVNVNNIVGRYRGCVSSSLWAALALKYDIPAYEAVDLLRRTLYHSAPFEYCDEDHVAKLMAAVEELRGGEEPSRKEMLESAIQRGADDGSDAPLRFLCFRGVPDECGLRPQVWKVMLGYLPMARHSEWNAIQGEKRALYADYKDDFLAVSEDGKVDVRDCGAQTGYYQDLLQEIRNDVDRTRRDVEYFRRPETRDALLSLLFIYARLNPGVQYVQGMNEVAAVVLWVMSADQDCAEADTFWCFNELMVEIKEGFMQALDDTGIGVSGLVERVNGLLRSYDPELAKHLEKAELPPLAFLVRWCTVLFAQDATLPEAVRLWDTFLADPRRFDFVSYMCLSLMLDCRDRLLATDKQFELAEVLQGAPRGASFATLSKRACAICSFERRRQNPEFPPKLRGDVMEDLSEWAQNAAAAAQEAAAKASGAFQESIAPVIAEKAGQAGVAAAVVAAEKAQALQSYWEETAEARNEALSQAGAGLSSLWGAVRATGAAAATRATETEAGAAAADRFSGVAGAAAGLWARTTAAAAAFKDPEPGGGEATSEGTGLEQAPRAKAGQPASQGYPV